jgi:hypothetical protein
MNTRILITTLAHDPHTQGLFKFTRLAREGNYEVRALPPGVSDDEILAQIQSYDPALVGFSYRLSPEAGVEALSRVMHRIAENGQLSCQDGKKRKFAFAGLPATVDLVEGKLAEFTITGIKQTRDPRGALEAVLDYLDIRDRRREVIVKETLERLTPPKIGIFDELAGEVIRDDAMEPPLDIPSEEAQHSYTRRIREVWPARPILRTHYGEPGDSIAPTLKGIEVLSEARVIDELSLGSSDLSQRFYNEPEKWAGRKNDGGVPYRNFQDLKALRDAARRGNFPAVKPYAHVVNLESFVDDCIRAGMLIGTHQAVPLFWFNRLDGRGETDVQSSIAEHIRTVAKLAQLGIPVEMNDPNQWSSRWASDAVIVADYGIIGSVMKGCAVHDMVFQMQFNKPKETSDAGDLAKFFAARDIIDTIAAGDTPATVWIESRTGIEHFEPDLEVARRQLARSTLLQMCVNPHSIHLVSYCEALYAAKPADIIRSSSIIRRAIRVFHQHQKDIEKAIDLPIIANRRAHLVKEATFLLTGIARLNPRYDGRPFGSPGFAAFISDADTVFRSIEQGSMAAPGIFTEPFRHKAALAPTDVIPGGMIDSIDPRTLKSISEEERLRMMRARV